LSLKSLLQSLSPKRRSARRSYERAIDEAAELIGKDARELPRVLERAIAAGETAFGQEAEELAAPLYALAAHFLATGAAKQALTASSRLQTIATAPDRTEPTLVQVKALHAAILVREDASSSAAAIALEEWARAAEVAGDAQAAGAAWNQVALTMARKGERDLAAVLFEKARKHRTQALGDSALPTLETIFNAATFRGSQMDLEVAEADLRLVVRALESQSREEVVELQASALHNLAVLREERGDAEEARLLYARALSVFEQRYGLKGRELRPTLVRLALLHHREGSLLLAIEAYDRAYEIATAELGAEHPIPVAIRAWKTELTEGVGPGAVERGLA
jgi:tetratricopeptide (TPR) repeat protein